MTGEILSHFEILETLGEGGMGVVYRARDTRLDRIVAIKLLPSRMLQTEVDRERFSLEAKAAANLSHPNICTVFEYDEVDGQALIAMECIEGPSLKDRIAEGQFSLGEAKRTARRIASGLAAAHAKGIVHRDIKPGNVLLTEGGVPKITDFGLAKLMGGGTLTQTGISLGTIAYMSPEQARGEEVGPATDVWALGAVMFEMLMGKVPFPHQYPSAIL
ncbi:MAG: serine/threonine-protein kinase, partial [Rhodothermales bacterium]